MSKKVWIALVVVILVGVGLVMFRYSGTPEKSHPPIPVGANESLVEHSKIFKQGMEKVTDGIYVAIGYGIANSIMIEGDDGLIIVDTMSTNQEAAQVLSEFRKISNKPIKAIVYTHNHADHVFGAETFAAGSHPDVYAHDTTDYYVKRILTEVRPVTAARSMRMFGSFLDPKAVINVGIGPFLGMRPDTTVGYIKANKTFSDTLDAEVAGVKFKLVFAPGETNDQIFMWLPDKKVLLPGDNFYWAFPNLYTIRGTPFRSLKNWYKSLDTMRKLHAEYMVPSHTRPVIGAKTIAEYLTNYRDAIQFTHDQSIRGINMGMTPDELAEYVQLPPHLAKAPYLQPFYGTVAWSVRNMFSGNLGWYSGDSADLQPLTRLEQAKMMASLAGGPDKLKKFTQDQLDQKNYQAALQLTGHLIRLNPNDEAARSMRIKALTALAEKEQNPNARNYYLTEALELRDHFVSHQIGKATPETLHAFDLQAFFESLAVNLDPVASAEIKQSVGMVFSDVNQAFIINVRYGVAEISQCTPDEFDQIDLDIKVAADSKVWKEMLGELRNPLVTLPQFDYRKGNTIGFARFLKLFQPAPAKIPCEPIKTS